MSSIPISEAQILIGQWTVGKTSIKYETGGRGVSTISTGVGDPGGASYGAYQLSSTKGTLEKYLNNPEYGNYAKEFSSLTPGTSAFNAKWKQIAETDTKFAETQHDFIRDTHYEKVNDSLVSLGYSMSDRGAAIQDMVWSTSVQFGSYGSKLIQKAIIEKFETNISVESLTDKQIIEAVQDYKINHNEQLFASSSEQVRAGTLFRAISEKNALLQLDGLQEFANSSDQAKSFNLNFPSGDSIDATLPDGTSVVSTSITVNGQTTVTAQLLDKDGHVLLSAGPGQTMERDPDTGIVQVRTGTSDQVQQYDPATGEVSNALRTGSDAAQVYENLLDVFSNPQLPTDKGTQIADASGSLPDTSAPTNANTNTFTHYLDTQGDALTTAQQDALAAQIDKLGLGSEKSLSFYTLPNGGALIATAEGHIVGEINRSSTGDLSLKATTIDASGNTVEVNQHINEQGSVLTQDQYNTQAQQQASALFNSFMAANNWDHLSDVGKLSALANLYNATDKLGEAFGATGNNLPGDLGAAAGWLSLAQGLQSGDSLIIANGINVVSDRALDNAMNEAFGNTAASGSVTYLIYALLVRNFIGPPEQSEGTLAAGYFREAANHDEMLEVA